MLTNSQQQLFKDKHFSRAFFSTTKMSALPILLVSVSLYAHLGHNAIKKSFRKEQHQECVCVTLYWAFKIVVKSCYVVWLVKENNDLCVKISFNAYRMCGMESRLYSHTLRLCVIPFVCLGLNS